MKSKPNLQILVQNHLIQNSPNPLYINLWLYSCVIYYWKASELTFLIGLVYSSFVIMVTILICFPISKVSCFTAL